MAESTTSLPPVPPPNVLPPIHTTTDRAPVPNIEPGQLLTAQVVRLLAGSAPGPYRLEISLLDQLLPLASREPYPAGTQLRLRATRIGAEIQLRIIDATPPPIPAESAPVGDGGREGFERVLGAALRLRGTNGRNVDVRGAVDMLRSMGITLRDDRAQSAVRVVADLVTREVPLTPDLIRGGLALADGVLERPVTSIRDALLALVERHVPVPQRAAALRSIARIFDLVSGTADRAATTLPDRTARAIDQLLQRFTGRDPELAAVRSALESLRGVGSRGSNGAPLEGRVHQLLFERIGSQRSTETVSSDVLRDLSPGARSRAIETFVFMERENLEAKPWFSEVRSIARELMSRATALAHLQWLELGSVDEKGTVSLGSGVFADPDGRMPFRMTVTDERDGVGDSVGFRIAIDSKKLGTVEIEGRLATDPNSRAERGKLALEFVTDDPTTSQQVAEGVASLTEALERAGYDATARTRSRSRASARRRRVVDSAAGLDLQA